MSNLETDVRTGLTDAYGAVNAKGGQAPQDKNLLNLGTAIASIPSGGGGGLSGHWCVAPAKFDGSLGEGENSTSGQPLIEWASPTITCGWNTTITNLQYPIVAVNAWGDIDTITNQAEFIAFLQKTLSPQRLAELRVFSQDLTKTYYTPITSVGITAGTTTRTDIQFTFTLPHTQHYGRGGSLISVPLPYDLYVLGTGSPTVAIVAPSGNQLTSLVHTETQRPKTPIFQSETNLRIINKPSLSALAGKTATSHIGFGIGLNGTTTGQVSWGSTTITAATTDISGATKKILFTPNGGVIQ